MYRRYHKVVTFSIIAVNKNFARNKNSSSFPETFSKLLKLKQSFEIIPYESPEFRETAACHLKSK